MPLGPWELLIIAFFVLLLFGARRLPEIGRSLGRSMVEFKDAVRPPKDEEPEPELLELEPPAEEREQRATEPRKRRSRTRVSG